MVSDGDVNIFVVHPSLGDRKRVTGRTPSVVLHDGLLHALAYPFFSLLFTLGWPVLLRSP
jgi:hypothetical protein